MKVPYRITSCLLILLLVLSACVSNYQLPPETIGASQSGTKPTTTPPLIETTETPIEEAPYAIEENEEGEKIMEIANAPQKEYGYSNIDGTKIIVLYDHEFDDNSLLTYFKYAVGENGKSLKIEYSTYQEKSEGNNGRQSVVNFDNEPGCIYTILDATAIPNETYMLLTQEEYENIRIFQEIEKTEKKDVSDEVIEKCEEIASRDIKSSWKLSEYQNGFTINMIEFENEDEDLLAWLVLDDGKCFQYFSFPATLSDDGRSGWRLEDHGALEAESIAPLCTIQNESGVIVCFSWYSEEVEIIHAIEFFADREPNGMTVSGRYIYPV